MKTVIIIPARYRSSRFPGKPLVEILGRSIVHRVWVQCASALPPRQIFVATDSPEIANHCLQLDMQVLMTSADCLTGTDRVFEASGQVQADVYVNVQGDEPLVEPSDVRAVISAAAAKPGRIINAMCPIEDERDFRSSTVPKVVARPDGRLLYMSRAPIPTDKQLGFARARKQVCIYAFPREALEAFSAAKRKTPLEQIEDIEILRFLELGWDVEMVEVSSASVAVDVPSDVARVEEVLRARGD